MLKTDPSPDYFAILVCPVDGAQLQADGVDWLACPHGHRYPVVEGVPVLLRDDDNSPTIGLTQRSRIDAVEHVRTGGQGGDIWFVDTLGVTDGEKAELRAVLARGESSVDPVASFLVAATNGILYKRAAGRLERIPVPNLRLPPGDGKRLLDVGCSWGRWSLAAACKGYRPIGVDPSLGAVLAAKRLARRMELPFDGVVADARYLPLKKASVDVTFSYSVIQHFSKADARRTLARIAEATRPGGTVKIQMASAFGIRSLQHILRRWRTPQENFDVRYWSPWELQRAFEAAFGEAALEVDCYFGLGLQPADADLYSPAAREAVRLSEWLRRASNRARPLIYLADSLYVDCRNASRITNVEQPT